MTLRDERGITLVEILLAMSLMLAVTAPTLQTLGVMTRSTDRNQRVVDSVDRTRSAVERISRFARNATGDSTTGASTSGGIARAGAFDMVFQSVDPNAAPSATNPQGLQTVRYCVDAANRALLEQRRPGVATPAVACPDPAWPATSVAADVANGDARPVFSYDAPTPADVASVTLKLFIDADPAAAPSESLITSGIYLRNQNRRPTAAFTAIPGPNRHVQINGSASADPEGQMLTFTWKDGDTELPEKGPVLDYLAPATGARTITLVVTDAGGLTDSTTQTMEVRG